MMDESVDSARASERAARGQTPAEQTVADSFAEQASRSRPGLVAELFAYLRHTRKWWLTPILVLLGLLSLLSVLAGTGAAPFIYALF